MKELLSEIAVWAEQTFPNEGVTGKLAHLKEEIEELLDDPTNLDEWADCFLLLFDAARKQGIEYDDIAAAMRAKFERNKLRRWVEDMPGIYHHVREGVDR